MKKQTKKVNKIMKLYYLLKMYIWAIKESYSFMKGLRDWKFWIKLPFVSFLIAYKTIYY